MCPCVVLGIVRVGEMEVPEVEDVSKLCKGIVFQMLVCMYHVTKNLKTKDLYTMRKCKETMRKR